MKKILLLTFSIVILFSGCLVAQSREDVVYLNNGGIMRGKVLENIPGVHTSLEMTGRNLVIIPDSAVKMILMDQVIPARLRENNASPVEMAASVSFFGGSKNSAGCSFITSYRFPFRLSLGVGIGNEWFDHQQIPFLADIKYCFLKGSWSPYVYAQSGYAITLSKTSDGNNWYGQNVEYYGGVLAGTGAGMRFNFTGHNALIFSVGYRYQKTKTVNAYNYGTSYEDIVYDEYNRMTFSFGFLFN